MKPAIFGLSDTVLTPDERAFFKESRPAGYILFKRNIADRDQLHALTDDLRSLDGRADLPILIDQEGGRVARMRAPIWPEFPAGQMFDALYEKAPMSALEAARANAHAIALILSEVGISVNCLPLLDVRQPETHDIIGDRALGAEPMRVASLGRAILDGLRDGGVVGVVKHMPGHGRATADSHLELPVVNVDEAALEIDIAPFERLNDAPMGMTAHVVYTAWDAERCASLSPVVIERIIRGRIGFDGLLMSDDLDMKALKGERGALAVEVLAAGCDIALDCWGRMAEMQAIANAIGDISSDGLRRLNAAMATIAAPPATAEFAELVAKRDALLALA